MIISVKPFLIWFVLFFLFTTNVYELWEILMIPKKKHIRIKILMIRLIVLNCMAPLYLLNLKLNIV
ncbi:MAG: hypothetical protein COU63_01950 [Candidatus Pacebacteria bacterium CG10_big_fil_rev_8_21_14_0_10_36_11]|nr:MAG: hypothetical protein COU63_01950 [Candidatus Pacebacteria bacterium CG10_big_fil_rev_8_21_14_0_10_36_11]